MHARTHARAYRATLGAALACVLAFAITFVAATDAFATAAGYYQGSNPLPITGNLGTTSNSGATLDTTSGWGVTGPATSGAAGAGSTYSANNAGVATYCRATLLTSTEANTLPSGNVGSSGAPPGALNMTILQNQGSSSGQGSPTYVMTGASATCAAGQLVVAIRFWVYYSLGPTWQIWYVLGTYVPPCTTLGLTNTQAMVNGTSETVAFRDPQTTPPASYSIAFTTATGTPVAVTATAVATDPHWFYGSATAGGSLTIGSSNNATVSRSGSSCTQAILETSGTASSTPNTTGATNPSGGLDCGLNPFCYTQAAIQWAFVPSSATMSNWQSQISSWQTHAPISLAVSGYQSLTILSTGIACSYNGTLPSWAPGDQSTCGTGTGQNLATQPTMQIEGQTVNLLSSLNGMFGSSGTYSNIYSVMTAIAYIGFSVWVWRRVSESFGSKDDDGD